MPFQSTPSGWRETTRVQLKRCTFLAFQSTPSGWRETLITCQGCMRPFYFNPLPPGGGRRQNSTILLYVRSTDHTILTKQFVFYSPQTVKRTFSAAFLPYFIVRMTQRYYVHLYPALKDKITFNVQ